ncbi:nuclear transport factor 2 family protein [Microbacterium halotolerans]|uniref:nuclear transport factor 2 family protein n=1 Tax=Microbacterium halotolerans TaxID=246613 RepID=UPI0013C2A927|nr:nuclear transport factor 2 family protein [Microbacterium halotolerans]
MTNYSTLALVRELHRALEAGRSGKDIRSLFHEDVEMIEHPNALKPHGGVFGVEQLIASSAAGVEMLLSQTFQELSAVVDGGHAALRVRWQGVVAVDAGPFEAGQELTAHVAQFATAVDGRILRLETYDCYEPF